MSKSKFPKNVIFSINISTEDINQIDLMCGLENLDNMGYFIDEDNQEINDIIENVLNGINDIEIDIGVAESYHIITLPETADPSEVLLDIKNKLIKAGAKELVEDKPDDKPKDYTPHKNIITVGKDITKMSKEAKDFVNDINNTTKTCPFCGKKPLKEIIELGPTEEEIANIQDEEEYQVDPDYRRIMIDFIKSNANRMECRISCINEKCLQPTTGFCETIDATETKWNTRF
jgi:hypothetical protein